MEIRSLYEAAVSGNVDYLNKVIQEDAVILDRITVTCFHETPLHISALRGHLDFIRALLSQKPKLATELDSLGRTPLHLASAEGHADVVRELLLHGSTNVCLVRDHEGRLPLHVAAMKGRVEVIEELIKARPEAIRERVDRGQTVLHLCVKHYQLEALKKLMDLVSEDDEMVGSIDDHGNTILHVAAGLKQMETIKYLVTRRGVREKANTLNWNGFTALDVFEHSQGMEIRELLLESGVQRAKDFRIATTSQPLLSPSPIKNEKTRAHHRDQHVVLQILKRIWNCIQQADSNWLEAARGNLSVVATVVATMAFQVGVNPPGGVWQETKPQPTVPSETTHQAGRSVLASYKDYEGEYKFMMITNTVSFVASVFIILLMVCGFPLNNKVSMWLMVGGMCITICFMGITYLLAVDMILADEEWNMLESFLYEILYSCLGFFGIVMFIHTARVLAWMVIKLRRCLPQTTSPNHITV